jgi:hypothetical protein
MLEQDQKEKRLDSRSANKKKRRDMQPATHKCQAGCVCERELGHICLLFLFIKIGLLMSDEL